MNDHIFLPSSGWVCSSFIGILSVSLFLLRLLFKKRSRDAVSETIKVDTDQYDENIILESRGGLGYVGTLNALESQNVADDGCNEVVANREVVEFLGVGEGSRELSQRSLINTVFILLNDEMQMNQLVATAANFDYYARGSSIIFLRSGKSVVGALQVKESCAVRKMQFHDTFILFCKGVFRRDSAAANNVGLFMTSTTARLPLALELVGSYLFGEKKLVWRNIFKKFKAISHQDIKDLLRISFGTLDCDEKQIFLDIACFFIGTDKRIAFLMWEDCNSFAEDGIAILLAMSLVKIRHQKKLWMHDQLLSLLGEEIVLPGNHNGMVAKHTASFVEDAVGVRSSCMIQGTTELEAIHADDATTLSQELLSQWESNTIDGWQDWSSLQMAHRLKILVLMSCQKLRKTPNFSWFPLLERLRIEYCGSLEEVDPSLGSLQNLISLSVKYCRMIEVLPQELGSLKALTELCIDGTCVKELPPLKGLKMLAALSARNCRLLSQIPFIGHLTSLVELQLDKSGVCQIPDSIAALAKLRKLHLQHTSIHTLPDSVGELHNLEVVKVSSSNIMQLPSALRKLEKLEVIDASSCINLDGLSFQDMRLYSLKTLILDNTNIRMLPASLSKLLNLQTLDLIGCTKLDTLPELPKSLQSLSVTCKPIVTLPNLSNLVNLEKLTLTRCENLVELPSDIGKLSKLKTLSITHSRISMLPEEISTLSQLHDLAIRNCKRLQCIPKLPASLGKLEVKGISAKKLPDLSISANLLELSLSDCSKLEEISGLGCLTSLKKFSVSKCTELTELDGLEKLGSLRKLRISECDSLDILPDLSKLRQMQSLVLRQCTTLNSLPGLFGLKELRHLDLSYCKKLQELEGLEELESLQTLDISGCKEMEVLPSLSRLQNLKDLSVRGCDKLQEIRGLEDLRSQLSVYTHGCTSLQNISNSRNIKIQG